MKILTLDEITFTPQAMFARSQKSRRRKSPSSEMIEAADRAYLEGLKCLEMRYVVEIYQKLENESDAENITLSLPGGSAEILHVGPRAGYLLPAKEIAVALCTVGTPLISLMNKYGESGDCLMMYYLDLFGVLALSDVSTAMRNYVADAASEKGWGVGPSMQPGSVAGWEVCGQRDLYRLGYGEKLGLSINDASFLIPHISNSSLIGLGPHYSANHVGSMCHECPRREECLWRRENITEENQK
ncbi:MAG: hypothetical protein RRY12_02340 [Cloacibacillus sp.]